MIFFTKLQATQICYQKQISLYMMSPKLSLSITLTHSAQEIQEQDINTIQKIC